MTAFDRIERRLPELFDELAGAGIPDYFDDMLQRTTQARQRPAWSALERWLPMGVIARPLPIRPMPWRLIAIAALLVAPRRRDARLRRLATCRPAAVRARPQRSAPHRHGRRRHRHRRPGHRQDDPAHRRPDASTVGRSSRTTASGSSSTGGRPRPTRRPRCTSRMRTARMPMSSFPAGAGRQLVRVVADRRPGAHHADDRWRRARSRSSTSRTARATAVAARSRRRGRDVASEPRPARRHRQGRRQRHILGRQCRWHGPARQIARLAVRDQRSRPSRRTARKLAYATLGAGRCRRTDPDRRHRHRRRPYPHDRAYHDGYVWQNPRFSPDGTHMLVRPVPPGTRHRRQVGDRCRHRIGSARSPTHGRRSRVDREPAGARRCISPDGDDRSSRTLQQSLAQTTWTFDADGTNAPTTPFVAIRGATWQRQSRLTAPGELDADAACADGFAARYSSAFASAASIAAARSAPATPRGSLPFGQ